MGWIATVTNKGYALQAKLLSTDKLNITRVVSGAGSCATTQLINQTAVTDIKQELTVDGLSYDKYGNARLKVILNNIDLTTAYDVYQIGVYATDPDEGEILYAIAQGNEADHVPSISEQPNGYYCAWDLSLTYSNAQNIDVTIDPSNAISQEEADKRYIQISKIGDNLSVDEDGTLSADAQEITVDAELNDKSTNPVQNKAVYKAIENNKYTHPSHTAKSSGLYKVQVDSKGHVVSATAVQKSDITALGIPSSNSDTKNTAGASNTSSKIYLIGATSQATNPQTYSHDTAYVGTDGCVYSDGKKVSVEGHSHALPTASALTLGGVKVGNGLTVDADGTLSATGTDVTIDSAMSSSSTNPVQNKVVNSALGEKVDKVDGKGLSSNDYTTAEKNKLAGIAEGANKYTHPSYTAKTSGLYKITVDGSGHVSEATAVTKSDITDLGIPSSDTKYSEATPSAAGLMGATDKKKLDGIEESPQKRTSTSITANTKLYLVGAKVQSGAGHETFTTANTYIDTDNCLYSNGSKVSTEGHTHSGYASSNHSHSEYAAKSHTHEFSSLGVTSIDLKGKDEWGNDLSANSANDKPAVILLGGGNKCNSSYAGSSLAVGVDNEVSYCSMAVGKGLKANWHQTVVGEYNTPKSSSREGLFMVGGGSTSATKNIFRVDGSSNKCYGINSFTSSGADYAEYMEWEDGNPNNEDRRGRMVAYALTDVECTVEEIEILHPDTHEPIIVKAVVAEKMPTIRFANSFDECIGIISGSASFIGNSSSEEWNNRFLKDVFGEQIREAVLIPEETKTYKVKETDEETGEEVIVEKTEVIPEHWEKQTVLNPHYDPEKEYISREFRQEWDPVGMVGMVVVEDDGTCVVGGYCKPSTNGRGTAAETGYRVLQRIDNTHVRVLVK